MWTYAVNNKINSGDAGGNAVYQGIILPSMREAMDSLAKQVSENSKQEVVAASIFGDPEKEAPQENIITDELDEQAVDLLLEHAQELGLDEETISLLREFKNSRKELENLALIKQNKKLLEEVLSIKIALETAMESLKQKLGLQEITGKTNVINAIRDSLSQSKLQGIDSGELNIGDVMRQSVIQSKEVAANIASNILQTLEEKGHLPTKELMSQIRDAVTQQIELAAQQLLPEIQLAIDMQQVAANQNSQTPDQLLQQQETIVPDVIKMAASMIEVAANISDVQKQSSIADNMAIKTAANSNNANINADITQQIIVPNFNALAAQSSIVAPQLATSYASIEGSIDPVSQGHQAGCTCGCGGGHEDVGYQAQAGSVDKSSQAQEAPGICNCGDCASHAPKNMEETHIGCTGPCCSGMKDISAEAAFANQQIQMAVGS